MEVNIKVTGLDKVLKQQEKLLEQMDKGPGVQVMLKIGQEAMKDIDERFNTGGYGTWAPLSPITIARKGHGKILIDSTTMKNSVGIGEIENKRVTVTVPYGGEKRKSKVPGYHQKGNPDRNLPQRKIVEVTDRLLSRIRPIFKEWSGSWRS